MSFVSYPRHVHNYKDDSKKIEKKSKKSMYACLKFKSKHCNAMQFKTAFYNSICIDIKVAGTKLLYKKIHTNIDVSVYDGMV